MSDAEGAPRRADETSLPGGDFRLFIQKLGYQALISLGVLENPLTQTKRTDLQQARGVIDDLLMIREKTAGNLDEGEDEHLGTVLNNLQGHLKRLAQKES